jgi:aryl-alcohol dehydrogenase-like predicted oxidoreductase
MSNPDRGVGCVKLGSSTSGRSERSEIRLVQQAIDMGYTVFDTADVYGGGASERLLGKAVRGRRDAVRIATKFGYDVRDRSPVEQWLRRRVGGLHRSLRASTSGRRDRRSHDPLRPPTSDGGGRDFSAGHLRGAVEGSLRRLAVEHIDVYQFHGATTIADDAMAALLELRDDGKIGMIGLGAETYAAVRATMTVGELEVVQLPFGLLDREPLDGIFDQLAGAGRRIWVRGILGGGLLSRAMSTPDAVEGHPKAAAIRAFDGVARTWGMSLDELAIRWVCTVAPADLVLFGMSSSAHLGRNLALADEGPLPAELCTEIAAVPTAGG